MPNLSRRQVLDNLRSSLPAENVEDVFKLALREANITDKPIYRPEEVSLIARAIVERGQREIAAGVQQAQDFMTQELEPPASP